MLKKLFNLRNMVAIAICLAATTTAGAQEKGDMAVGGNLVLGTGNSYTNIGIGAKFQYNVTQPIRLEGSFTYFLEKDYVSMWDLGVNGHWLFAVAENKFNVYPLAGLGIMGIAVDHGFGSASSSEVCFNFGGGIDYSLTEKLVLNAEAKYKVVENWNRLVLSVGLAYRF